MSDLEICYDSSETPLPDKTKESVSINGGSVPTIISLPLVDIPASARSSITERPTREDSLTSTRPRSI